MSGNATATASSMAAATERRSIMTIEDLEIRFDIGAEQITAVKDLSLSIADNEFVAIVGPSGCGKSTMLKVLVGLVQLSGGRVIIDGGGQDTSSQLAMVFQEPRLLPWRNVLDNIAYPLEAKGVKREDRRELAMAEIRRVGLTGFENAYPRQLSGGMQQRVNLARALVADPRVLLLDEPFAALDAQTRELMQQELLEVCTEKNKTALFVTHQVDEALYLADRVVLFTSRPGRVKQEWEFSIPRPRPLDVKRTAQFHEIQDEISGAIDRPHV